MATPNSCLCCKEKTFRGLVLIAPIFHNHSCRAVDQIFALVVQPEAHPSCAAFLKAAKGLLRLGGYAEGGAWGQLVERQFGLGVVVGIVVMQLGIDLLFDGAAERDARSVLGYQRGNVVWEIT